MEEQEIADPAPITGRFATSEEESWHTFRRQSEQETPKRLEEAAKYLSGLISISFTIFLSLEEGRFQKIVGEAMTGFICMVWVLSLGATLFVIFPLPWRQMSLSATDIERVHRASVKHKYRMLVLGVVLFWLAIGTLAWTFLTSAS